MDNGLDFYFWDVWMCVIINSNRCCKIEGEEVLGRGLGGGEKWWEILL